MPDTYSQAILEGLAKRRPLIVDPARQAGIPANRLAAAARGEVELTDDEVGRLEDVADLTGLELALAAIDPDGAELNGVAEAWARVRDAGKRHPASPPADRQRTAEVG